jgi:hypothetical protein
MRWPPLEVAIPLTEYEKGTYESGGRRFEKIVLVGAHANC